MTPASEFSLSSEKLEVARGSLVTNLSWAVICLGIVLRLRQFIFNRSLWYDESHLALNIIEKSFSELLKPLDYNQAAPVGFLMLEKLMVETFGSSEFVLRCWPFLAGILSLILFYTVAKGCVGTKALVIGLGLFALSDPLIYYSSELKQYSSDVTLGLFLSFLGLFYLERKELTNGDIVLLGLVGPIAVSLSYPAVFILAGVGLTLIAADLRDKKWQKVGQVSVVCLFWLLGFAILYFASLRSLANNDFFENGWRQIGSFMPLASLSLADLRWFPSNFFEVFRYPAGLSLAGIAALAFVIGCNAFLTDKPRIFFMLISPVLFTLLASGLQKYPFKGRLLLFIVPAILLVTAKGVEVIIEKTWHNAALIGIATTALLFFHPLFYASQYFLSPRTVEEGKPILHYVKDRKQDGDILYLYYGAKPMFKYYQGKYGFTDSDYVVGVKSRKDNRNYVTDLEILRGRKRVWVVFSHAFSRQGINEKSFFLYHLDNVGTKLDAFESPGAAVYLYDLSERRELETPAKWRGLPHEPLRQSSFRE